MLVSIIFMAEIKLYLLFFTLGSQQMDAIMWLVWKVTEVFMECIGSAFFTENKTFSGGLCVVCVF